MAIYGYARVSHSDQNEARQLVELRKEQPDQIFVDKCSGKDFNRPEYKRLVRRLRKGDTLFIESIDRLGRNYEEIMEQRRRITKSKGADIVVLDMPLLDTRIGKDLLGTFVSDMVLQILSFVAQTEREAIKERQRQGIEAARARGVKFGRPKKERPEMLDYFAELWKSGGVSAAEAARTLGIAPSTFRWWATGN